MSPTLAGEHPIAVHPDQVRTTTAPAIALSGVTKDFGEVQAVRGLDLTVRQGEVVAYEDILEDIRKRDARDGGRADSPMRPADDSVLLDTSEMTIEQATDAARRIVEAARARWENS